MGDRCSCTLYLRTEPSVEHKAALDDLANQSWEPRVWSFDEVNYSTIDAELQEVLDAIGIDYAWENEPGCEYGHGVVLCVGGERTAWETNGSQIVLTIDNADDAETRALARRWQSVWDSITKGEPA